MPLTNSYNLSSIGIVHSCYKEKFGIPRQPGLVTEATARIELLPPYNRMDMLDGLEDFTHIWVQFIFHACLTEKWKAKVRPPRLGGKTKVGIFSTRATHRPNPIGLSVVKLGKIHQEGKSIFIELHGADLLDGTPVLDIKPYLPYADIIKDAQSEFVSTKPSKKHVVFSELAESQCNQYQSLHKTNIRTLIKQVIEQDPRPSYLLKQTDREHGTLLWNMNIKWCARQSHLEILRLENWQESEI